MNFTERIALSPWGPKIAWTLFALMVFVSALANRAAAEEAREFGFQECQQAQLVASNLRLELSATHLATDEIPSVPWPYPLPGDLNGDCKVNIVDIMLVVKEWGNECQSSR